jgi:hypothetical protein
MNGFGRPACELQCNGVQEYRAFMVGPDGHFSGFESMFCTDNAEAIEKAKHMVDGHDIELWS